MIDPNSIKKSQAKKILQLIEEQTKADVISRLVDFGSGLGYADYALTAIQGIDNIRKYIYGTDSLVELAGILNISLKRKKRKKKKRKKKRSS